MLYAVAEKLDRLGLRPLVAKAASLAYPGQSFSVDSDGDWVSSQAEATIVSPEIYTSPYSHAYAWVMDNWTYCYTPKPGDILVDLGTGIGEEAVVFSKLIGGGTMLAVEAHPVIYRCLTKTIKLSQLSNVQPIHCAVGGSDGETLIDDGENILTGSIMNNAGVPVPQFTLDTLTAGLERIDFLRTNIEGAEKLMLHGMKNSIRKIRNACVSCHDFLGRPAKAEVIAFFEKHGFETVTRPDTPDPMCDYVYASRPPAHDLQSS